MSLDTEKIHRLKAKSFDKLYTDHKTKWDKMVSDAAAYTKTYVTKLGDQPRPADAALILQTSVRVDVDFEAHLEKRKLQQKYWAVLFADYIVEQFYPPPKVN